MRFFAPLACAMSVLLAAAPAAAQVTPLGASFPVPAGAFSRFVYDDQNHVYLHVWEFNRDIWARFVAPDGTALGVPFAAAPHKLSFAGKPKVAYGAGEFLLTYASDFNQYDIGSNVYGQIIAYTGGGPSGGGIFGDFIPISPFSNTGGTFQVTADVVYNPLTQRFLVAYDELFSEGWEAMVRLFQPNGTSRLARSGGRVERPRVAGRDRARVRLGAEPVPRRLHRRQPRRQLPDSASSPASSTATRRLFRVQFVVSVRVRAGAGCGVHAEADGFLMTWTAFTPTRDVLGRYVSTSGGMPFPVYGVMASPFLNRRRRDRGLRLPIADDARGRHDRPAVHQRHRARRGRRQPVADVPALHGPQ